MTFENVDEFAGMPVQPWLPGQELPAPGTAIPRLSYTFDAEIDVTDLLQALLDTDGVEQLTGLSIGLAVEEAFDTPPQPVADMLIANADKLPALTTLIWCDIAYEECEVSWIQNIDVGPLLNAFPKLEHVLLRGGNDLRLTDVTLPELQTLIIQTGGMSQAIVRDVEKAKLPKLNHLELYFGAEDYGAECTVEDTDRILSGELFPHLTRLGLCNCEFVNELPAKIIESPLLPRLSVLDLSLGVLQDHGAQVLVDNLARFSHLDKLDLQHHYLSDAMMTRFEELGDKVDLSEQEEDEGEEFYFVAIGE